jgi:murein L,D-transpeptidase YcbB/YkuD
MAKSWRVAKGLLRLREQINARYPGRKKGSDGTIGNAEHSARSSDHNPDVDGVVKALDTTHDPAHGFDSYSFSDMLIANRDPRIKYVISNGQIASGPAGPYPWTWRKYKGTNKHDHHNHVSIRKEARYFDDETPWKLDGTPMKGAPSIVAAASTYVVPPRTLRKGNSGVDVKKLQQLLKFKPLDIDGRFGVQTRTAVIAHQRTAGIRQDGIVGPQTWKALGA